MMYQAIYDATRSRIGACDPEVAIREAVESALGSSSRLLEGVATEWVQAARAQQRPSVLYRPRMFIDGNQWCALYGESLMTGVAGFGSSPAAAMEAFDVAWQTRT